MNRFHLIVCIVIYCISRTSQAENGDYGTTCDEFQSNGDCENMAECICNEYKRDICGSHTSTNITSENICTIGGTCNCTCTAVEECNCTAVEECNCTAGETSNCTAGEVATGVIIAVLFISLVGVIAGWVRTCFVMQKLKFQLSNTTTLTRASVYSTLRPALPNPNTYSEPPPLPHATYYSSVGPDYEVLRIQQEGEQTNNSIQITNPGYRLSGALEQNEDHTYQVLENENFDKLRGPIEGEGEEEVIPQTYEVPVDTQKKEDKEKE